MSLSTPSIPTEVYSIESDGKVALSPDQILHAISGLEDLKSVSRKLKNLEYFISEQTRTIESLRRELCDSKKWQAKLNDWIWSGIIGAILGLLLNVLLQSIFSIVMPHLDTLCASGVVSLIDFGRSFL